MNINLFLQRIKRKLRPFLSFPKSKDKMVVVMIDGELYHGGLTDRFRHIMSIYSFCKEHSLNFKIYYTYPCKLEKILIPNQYNWKIKKKDLSYSFIDSKDILIYSCYKTHHISKQIEIQKHLNILSQILKNKRKNFQYHIYGNCYFAEQNFSALFNELFKPSDLLQKKLDKVTPNQPYEAVVLRFQQLLGDLLEGNFPVLGATQRFELIKICIEKIKNLYEQGYFSTNKVLVTSDSSTFLDAVCKELDFVLIIPGRNVHMDFHGKHENEDVYMKSFVDFLMLSNAQKITCLKTSIMYDTGFPNFAANIGNIEYKEIIF